ncbi:eclosion hormone-like [Ochlerotatus camptorhynchus]|uniref:eclosion hormone-like n=1 Tax=Ochlerotatus camptorhynchus TaxID=644619 RepID=UPI0031D7C107
MAYARRTCTHQQQQQQRVHCIYAYAQFTGTLHKKMMGMGMGSHIMGGYDFLGVCINNCAQCKKLYGAYFDGQLCADACIKFRGKIIPDCDDIGSITPFLNKLETQ